MDYKINNFELYKEKSHDFIDTINSMLGDSVFFPEQHGGKFELNFREINNGMQCDLSFKQDSGTHVVICNSEKHPQEMTDIEKAYYYKNCYFRIFRSLLFSVDSVNNTTGNPNVLSLQTMANEGLNKIKNQIK